MEKRHTKKDLLGGPDKVTLVNFFSGGCKSGFNVHCIATDVSSNSAIAEKRSPGRCSD